MILLNKEQLRDKIYACWLGKNIGGTLGGPYERVQEFLDVTGYTTEKGTPLPNDDLDLQLVFLCALEELGPYGLNTAALTEYWVNYIPPHWNEYGVAKANIKAGILAPLCGELFNEKWKHSNGAWIRSELWACLTPGLPQLAARFAFMDACIDHGMSEGTYAEIFTTYLQCNAFFNSDIRDNINKALDAIPAECRVAQSVRLAIECYEKGMTLRESRDALVKDSEDLGWFQAPANVGYVILGLLYGEGDFKKSVLAALNCGDDTDCTAATVGAFLGILYGTKGIPADWQEYIGDSIVNVAVDLSLVKMPKSCTELTDRIMDQVLRTISYFDLKADWTDGEDKFELGYFDHWAIKSNAPDPFANRTQYCYDYPCPPFIETIVCFDKEPILKPNDEIKVSVVFRKTSDVDQSNGRVTMHLPEGFSCDYPKNIQLCQRNDGVVTWNATVKAGDSLQAMNRLIMEIDFAGSAMPALIPINLLG